MLIAHLQHPSLEEKSLPAVIKQGLAWLRNADFATLENQKYEIDGNKLYVNVIEYETKPYEETKAEVHQNYLDIQYIIEGEEVIGVGYPHPDNELMQAYDEAKDRTLYKDVVNECPMVFKAGMYGVFYPTDVHRPVVAISKSVKVRKAVVKVAIDAL